VNAGAATNIKASGGRVVRWYMTNSGTAPRYVKLYDKASAPTIGTDVPSRTIMIPANGESSYNRDREGWPFVNGIGLGVTTGVLDTDTTAPGANEVVVNIDYV
jgi:hypothetical protein